jgi:predicted DNA-binding ribbon-helix-helix protein
MRHGAALTLRLDEELYTKVKELAQVKKTSITALIQGVLSEALRNEEKRALYDAFTLVGQDQEDADVEFALSAQREVVAHQ